MVDRYRETEHKIDILSSRQCRDIDGEIARAQRHVTQQKLKISGLVTEIAALKENLKKIISETKETDGNRIKSEKIGFNILEDLEIGPMSRLTAKNILGKMKKNIFFDLNLNCEKMRNEHLKLISN